MKTIIVYQEGIETKALKNETLIAPEWFAMKKYIEFNKKFNHRFEGFDNRIWAIIGETEKAYHVLLGNAFHHVATWIPKSLVSVDKEPNDEDITLVCDFATAMEIAKETFKSFN